MTKMTNYLESKLANHVLKNTAYTPPTNIYVALHTADPTETGAVSEITTASFPTYARKQVIMGAESGGICLNSADILWDNCPAITISHVSIWDALSGGNALFYGPLSSAQVMASGNTFRYPTGQLSVGFD